MVNHAIIFSVLFLVSILVSCSKSENAADPFCVSFVPGDVSLGVDKKLSFEASVALINSNNLPIEKVYTLVYRSTLPSDSISYIITQLNKKKYITSQGEAENAASVYEKNDSLTVLVSFSTFDEDAQTDWFKTVATLDLFEQPNLKSFLLSVPAGEEKDWIRKFLAQQNIAYAQLNCNAQINPYVK